MEYILKNKRMIAISLVVFIAIFYSSALAVSQSNGKPILLVVANEDSITSADMDKLFMATHNRLRGNDKSRYDYRKLIGKLVNDRLILQEAKAIGMDEEPEFIDILDKKRANLAQNKFIKATFSPDLTPTDSEIQERFTKYYWKVQLRSISLRTNEEAHRMIHLVSSGSDMDSLAQAVSLDSRRYRGGLDNVKFWVDVPILVRNGVWKLDVGDLTDPIPNNEAYTFYRLEQRLEADPSDLDKVRRDIELSFRNEKLFQAKQLFYDELALRYPIVVDSVVHRAMMADSADLFNAEFLKGGEQAMMTVNNLFVTTDKEYRSKLSHTAMNAGNKTFIEILKIADEAVKRDLLLMAGASESGWLDSTEVLKKVAHQGDSILINMFLNEMVIPKIVFNREEFDNYYNDNLDDFRVSDEFQMRYMLIGTSEKADTALGRLRAGADFGFIKKLYHSDESEILNENEWFSLDGYPPSIIKAVEELETGEITEAFQTANGWVIFKLKGRQQGPPKPIDKVEIKIREIMFQRKFEEIMDRQLEILRENSSIEYFEDAIDEYLGMES